MNRNFCGLDFGTTNSSIGIQRDLNLELVTLEGENDYMPSAILFDNESGQILMGQSAKDHFMQSGEGRLMQSLKTVLGSSTIDYYTNISGFDYTFMDIIGLMIGHMKTRAEERADCEIDRVLLGRPVFYVDNDPERDKSAQDCMADIARSQGFKHVEFQYEPIAAAMDYEKSITREKAVLVADIGGGTADFSIVIMSPVSTRSDRRAKILANNGIHIGGNDFDTRLSLNRVMPELGMHTTYLNTSNRKINIPTGEFFDLAFWHRINLLKNTEVLSDWRYILKRSYEPEVLHRFVTVLEDELGYLLYQTVENSKIKLTSNERVLVDLGFIENGFEIEFQIGNLHQAITEDVDRLETIIHQTIKDAGLKSEQIEALYYVGGSTNIPFIRQRIEALVAGAEPVNGDIFGGVAKGLTIDAAQRFS